MLVIAPCFTEELIWLSRLHACMPYQTEWIGVGNTAYSPRLQKAVRFAMRTHEVYEKQKPRGGL